MRIGHGYDVHRLISGRKLILGGVEIPFDYGLHGHSDADVLAHAVADALLGAASLGDIGKLFPDTDMKYKDAASMVLLSEVYARLEENGYEVLNIDSTIIAEKPKLAPYTDKMRRSIAEALKTDIDCISVKATTQEGLGFSGRCEGIAAHAIALIKKI